MPPHETALARKRLGDSAVWDTHAELQAGTIDALHHILRAYQVVNFKDAPKGDIPLVPRPYDTTPRNEPKAVSLNDFASLVEGT